MNGLEITEIKMWPLRNPKPGTKLKANCRVTFNNCISINGKVWDSRNGLFFGADGKYGEKKDDNGKAIFYPSWLVKEKEDQQKISQAVVQEYEKVTGQASMGNAPSHHHGNDSHNMNEQSPHNNQNFQNNVPF